MNRLQIRSRVLVWAAALCLVAAQFLPLWKIELHAPQYPEGIGMLIHMDTLTGMKPADLDNLNGLNHYIGMQAIHADSFPALVVMPWIAGGLAALAVLVGALGRRRFLFAWIGALMLAGMAGFAEFYRWTYRYGHDLAPDAIIKVPGMTYQPPIIGSKQLLNFTADSWPALGGWLAVAAFLLGVAALLPFSRTTHSAKTATGTAGNAMSVLATVALVFIVGCTSPGTPSVAYGKADCAECHMRIVDNRYAAVAVTDKGKTHQFDSIECLANYFATGNALASVWVSDFDHPGTLIDATTARYVRKTGPSTAMGAGVLAFANQADSAALADRFDSPVLSWSDVRQLARHNALPSVSAVEHRHVQ